MFKKKGAPGKLDAEGDGKQGFPFGGKGRKKGKRKKVSRKTKGRK